MGSACSEVIAFRGLKLVYGISGGMLLTIGIIAAIWVKFYMKRGLFEPDLE